MIKNIVIYINFKIYSILLEDEDCKGNLHGLTVRIVKDVKTTFYVMLRRHVPTEKTGKWKYSVIQ
jgi:hypothetical protein